MNGMSAGRRIALSLVLLAGACGPRSAPRPLPTHPPAEPPSTPVVFVPGVTGVVLRDSATREIVWGLGRNLLRPKDDAYSLALPTVHEDPGLPVLEPVAPIEEIALFGIRKPIYGPIRKLLLGAGYVEGTLGSPRADATLFFFNYDWRRDLTESAGILRRQLEELRRVQGKDLLEIDLICQSSGAHLCRYLAKYGGVPLAEAETGKLPSTLAVRRLILVGSSNGGSLRILREIHRGRRYLPLIGRWMRPEVTFTYPALFQDLPVYRRDLFLDAKGRPLDIDLFDPAHWRRYGWSIYEEATARRLRENGVPRFLGDEADRDAWLRRVLSEGKRFQELLHTDVPGFGGTQIYVVGSADQPTPDRAILVRKGEEWRMLFTGDPALRRDRVLHAMATAEGDEHATLASQDWLSPQEQAALVLPPRRVRGGHFEALLTDEVRRFLLEALGWGRLKPEHGVGAFPRPKTLTPWPPLPPALTPTRERGNPQPSLSQYFGWGRPLPCGCECGWERVGVRVFGRGTPPSR